jgi:peptidoglycan hydrolase-like protein with peptidoglycan-binding domain
MFLASKAASVGIVFILLTTGISGPRPTPLAPRANLTNKVPAVGHRDDVETMQQMRNEGYNRWEVDGVFGLRTRASISGFQKADNLPATGQFNTETASKLGVSPEDRTATRNETTKGKPSAYIEWTKDSRRTMTPRRAVKPVAAHPRDREKTPAEDENHPP